MVIICRKALNKIDKNQVFWAGESEHAQQTMVLTKSACQQPGLGRCYICRVHCWPRINDRRVLPKGIFIGNSVIVQWYEANQDGR